MSEEEEARRALKRLEEQSEKLLGQSTPPDAEDDRIETLGRRIARILAYAMGGYLIYWLWKNLG